MINGDSFNQVAMELGKKGMGSKEGESSRIPKRQAVRTEEGGKVRGDLTF